MLLVPSLMDMAEKLVLHFLEITFLYFLRNLFRYLAMYFLAPIRNGVVRDIRNDMYLKILILPLSYYSEQKKGDIISRMTSDVQEIEYSIMNYMEMIIRDPITIIIYFIFLLSMSPKLTLFVIIILYYIFFFSLGAKVEERTTTKDSYMVFLEVLL